MTNPEDPRRDARLCNTCLAGGHCRIGIDDLRFVAGATYGEMAVPDGVEGHVVAHGGWTAWVFDEFLGTVPQANGVWAVTTELSIRYLRPVPIGARVSVRAWTESTAGARWRLRGEMRLLSPDTLLASAAGEWAVLPDADAFYARARAWSQEVVPS